MQKALLTSRRQPPESSRAKSYREVECSPAILLVLNGVIFQYLELQCLDETYRTLYDECKAIGLPIHSDIPSEIVSFPDSYREIQKLFTSFDSEDGPSLLEIWNSIVQLLGDDNQQELKKLGVLLRIYAALIPHRKNLPMNEKNEAMKQLKEFFESNSAECSNDEEMLPYFALPYVPNIHSHKVLSKLLKDEWVKKLRTRLEAAVSKLYTQKDALHPLESDLARLYFLWGNGKDHMMNDADGRSWGFRSVSTTENCPPNIPNECGDTKGKTSSVEQFFETIIKISQRNRRLLKSHRDLQKRYSETTDLCCVLLDALWRSCSGVEVNLLELKTVLDRFPHMSKRLNGAHNRLPEVSSEDMTPMLIVPPLCPLEVNQFKQKNEKYEDPGGYNKPCDDSHPTERKLSDYDEDSVPLKQIPSTKSTQTSDSATVIHKNKVRSSSKSAPNSSRTNNPEGTFRLDCFSDSDLSVDTPVDEMYFEGINLKPQQTGKSKKSTHELKGGHSEVKVLKTAKSRKKKDLRKSQRSIKNTVTQIQQCSARDPTTS